MQAPPFSLPDQTNTIRKLSEYQGKWRVVYFYPKDDTPGCTKEACNFRDAMEELAKRNIVVFGISKDTVKSHEKFVKKYNLNFFLLSDISTDTIRTFGAWAPKEFMGREVLGIIRKTVLINPAGEIVKTYQGMDLTKHAEEIINDIDTKSV